MQRGLIKCRLGQFDAGLEDLDAATRSSAEDPEIYAARGAIFLEKGDFRKALDDFNHTLLLRPNDPVSLARRGVALAKKGNVESALADLDEAIRLNASLRFQARNDSDFQSLSEDPRFTELLYPETGSEIPPPSTSEGR